MADREQRALTSRASAVFSGNFPEVYFEKLDLLDSQATKEILQTYRPDLIVNTGTLLSVAQWWGELGISSEDLNQIQSAGFGPWLPTQLLLPLELMKTVKELELDCRVVNASFPDVSNAVLGKIDLAPLSGTGNIHLLEPGMKCEISKDLDVNPDRVNIYMCAHYVHLRWGMMGGKGECPDFFLKAIVDGSPAKLREDKWNLLLRAARYIPWGALSNPISAASVMAHVSCVLTNSGSQTHVPGPNGLPGGYPVKMFNDKVELDLPDELPLQKAISINTSALPFDGIEEILDDGSVVFTEHATEIMKKILDYDCKKLGIQDVKTRAFELISLLKKLKS
jgi:hypothetical protein